MRIGELKKVLKKLIEMNEPVLLVGHAGIGKTQLVYQIGQELEREVKTVILSQLEPGDMMGLPVSINGKTEFLRPSWLPGEQDEGTILFLDELNRAPVYVRQAVLQLIQEKRIGPHVLPNNLSIVAAANPETDDYIVSEMNDRALLTRFIILTVQNSPSDFCDYLQEKGYKVKNILAAVGTLDYLGIFTESIPLPRIVPNPRAFERALRVIENIEEFSYETELEVLSGILGPEGAAEFVRRLLSNVLSPEDFINCNVSKIKESQPMEKIMVVLTMVRDGIIDKVPHESLDALTDEEWASVLRNIANDPEKYAKGFAILRKAYPRIVEILR